MLQLRILALLGVLLLGLAQNPARAGEGGGITARSVFALLPASIFENTPEGLSAAEKQRLLAEGHADFWEIAGETEDVLVFASLPFRDAAVALRLFRHLDDGAVEAAVGTLGGPVCTLELWRVDASGRAVPADTPPEPDVSEFLAKGQKLPPDVRATVMLCLGLGGLKALPLFWTSTGMAHVPVANSVGYQWNGAVFEKRVTPADE